MRKRLVSTLALTAVAACGAPGVVPDSAVSPSVTQTATATKRHAADPDTAGAHADLVTNRNTDSQATVRFGPFTRTGKPARTKTLDLTPDKPSYYTPRPTGVGDGNGNGNGNGKDDLVVTWSHVFADGMPTPRATVVYRGAAN
ncbi:hypothetical protein SAMN02787144_103555, partial [Streptomyces atratus]